MYAHTCTYTQIPLPVTYTHTSDYRHATHAKDYAHTTQLFINKHTNTNFPQTNMQTYNFPHKRTEPHGNKLDIWNILRNSPVMRSTYETFRETFFFSSSPLSYDHILKYMKSTILNS